MQPVVRLHISLRTERRDAESVLSSMEGISRYEISESEEEGVLSAEVEYEHGADQTESRWLLQKQNVWWWGSEKRPLPWKIFSCSLTEPEVRILPNSSPSRSGKAGNTRTAIRQGKRAA